MSQRALSYGLALLFATLTAPSFAQVSSSLVSNYEANRFGLERVWFTRVQFDRGRGRIAYVRQHVSSKHGYRVYEIKTPRGRKVITDRSLDRLGRPLGREGAQKQADKYVQQLKRSGIEVTMQTRVLPDITLYAVSDTGVVESIDGESGRTKWTVTVGKRDFPVEAPGANDDYVAVLNGSSIYLLDQATGQIVWRRVAVGAPGAGAAVSENYVFVPMIGGTIEGYNVHDGRTPPWIYQSVGRALIQPVIAGGNVAWPTDRGHLYVAGANNTGIRYRIETTKSIVARATELPPNRLLVLSTDGYVYCLYQATGALQWQFSTGEPLVKPAVVIGAAIYVVTDDDNLYRLDAKDGQEVWWAPRVRQVITASESRLYCIGDTGRMLIFDANTGGRLGEIATEVLDLHMINYHTDRIFIGSKAGIIQCMREVDAEWPIIRTGGLEEDADKKTEGDEGTAATEAAEEMPAEEPSESDPFGETDSGGDPFGSEPESPSATEDPFGF